MLESSPSASALPNSPSRAGVTVAQVSYHGWCNCYLIANGSLEAVVVPSIGRVMQLRRPGEADGVFWENRALDGLLHAEARDAAPDEWINFGGDKCWPAPQSAWPEWQGRAWPPPAAFDARPVECAVAEACVTLTSPTDSDFGIQCVRRIELDPEMPVMRITTEFHKIHGTQVRVAIWIITQMRHPERIFWCQPDTSRFAEGYVRLLEAEPRGLRREGRLLSLERHPGAQVKIGTDSTSLLWVGPGTAVRIDTELAPGEYPDGGCVTEVYTNPDPLPYVELETMSPLADMRPGDRIAHTTVYTVKPKSAADPGCGLLFPPKSLRGLQRGCTSGR